MIVTQKSVYVTSSTCGVRMVPTRKEARTSNPQRKYRNEHGSDIDESSPASSIINQSLLVLIAIMWRWGGVKIGSSSWCVCVCWVIVVRSCCYHSNIKQWGTYKYTDIYIYIYIYIQIIRGGSAAIFPTLRRRVAVGRNPFFGPHNLRQTAPHVTKIVTWVSHSSSCACMCCVYSSYDPAMLILIFVCWIVLLLNVISLSIIKHPTWLGGICYLLTLLTKDTKPGYFGKAEVVGKLTYRY